MGVKEGVKQEVVVKSKATHEDGGRRSLSRSERRRQTRIEEGEAEVLDADNDAVMGGRPKCSPHSNSGYEC